MDEKAKAKRFTLTIPLDASAIEDLKSGGRIKLAAKDTNGRIHSQTVKIDAERKAEAKFTFSTHPGSLHVVFGPADADDDELFGLQTLSIDVFTRQWSGKAALKIMPIKISPFYWHWWLRWCRTFTIRGQVVCPDGSPVPAAEVCAYDVDRWCIWSSTQMIGCATTDINGTFEIKFRWCCGWWPWWWWRLRDWIRNPILTERLHKILMQHPDLQLSPTVSNQPTLEIFNTLLAEEGLDANGPLRAEDAPALERIRKQLLHKLPVNPDLEALRIWPWHPWYPWRDCRPDVIFKVTQDCLQPGTVILDETIDDTRWNIDNFLDVTLVANDQACCLTPCQDPPCDEGDCIIYARVCDRPISAIGGNTGAPAVPPALNGYLHPNAVVPGTAAFNGDRPYGGDVDVWKHSGDLLNVDYYTVDYDDGTGWSPLPVGAGLGIRRHWLHWNESASLWTSGSEVFPYDASTFPGYTVYESREHFENTGPYNDWRSTESPVGGHRFWTKGEFLFLRMNSSKFSDGTYQFRVTGYQVDAGNNLVNEHILAFCGSGQNNYLVLTFDNRAIDPLLNASDNPCRPATPNSVKLCTTEPDTDIIAVRINGQPVDPCDVVDAADGLLEIDFRVHDTSGHLARYRLWATYKESLFSNLLALPGAVLAPLAPGTAQGPTYGQALAQGAVAPHWYGGNMRLTVPAHQAFPEPCCYQLELKAWKRTVVNCNHSYPHRNRSKYTLGVGVCPPPLVQPRSIEPAAERIVPTPPVVLED